VIIATLDSPSTAMQNDTVLERERVACLQDIPPGVRRFTLTRLGFRSPGQEVFDTKGVVSK
jgi:hypothetical protein